MRAHLKFLLALPLAAALFLPPYPVQGKDFNEVAGECRANIEPERLSPRTAEQCVKYFHDDPSILNRLKEESPDDASYILAYNSALKDFKKVAVSYKNYQLYPHFTRIMGGDSCPLCDLGLGPEPEKSLDWADKYLAQAQAAQYKFSVRTWDSLGPVRTPALEASGHGKDAWNGQNFIERYQALQLWSQTMAGQILSIPAKDYPDRAALARMVPVLKEDMFSEELDLKLDAYLKTAGVKPVPTGPAARPNAGKVDKASADAAALKGMTAGQQQSHLDNFFSGTGHRPAEDINAKKGASAKYSFKPLTPEQITDLGSRMLTQNKDGSLSGPMAREIKGTKAGDEILAFYKNKSFSDAGTNKLKFGFEKMDKGLFGGWNWYREDINLNSELVNDWMQKNKVTPDMLLRGDPSKNKHMAGLSEYLAPTFVHEATHQRQTAKDKRDGIDLFKYKDKSNSYYQMEKETEAFSMDASFTAEKYAKLGKAYAKRIDAFDKANMEVFLKQGVDGIRLSNHKSYSDKESLDGHAAKEFMMAKSKAMRLQSLQSAAADNPDALTPEQNREMSQLRQEMNSKFKWYTVTMKDSVESEKKMNLWRETINRKLYGNKSVSSSPVPTLLSP